MLRYGNAPYLECSSKGDARFSAFRAKVWCERLGKPVAIEIQYQAKKIFVGRTQEQIAEAFEFTFDRAMKAKGKKPLNAEECRAFYSKLWDDYIEENPHLIPVLIAASGLSDTFGQEGHACQAEELWRIRAKHCPTSSESPESTPRTIESILKLA